MWLTILVVFAIGVLLIVLLRLQEVAAQMHTVHTFMADAATLDDVERKIERARLPQHEDHDQR
jgi:hypothetical protein